MTEQQIREAIVSYIAKNGRCPNFASIGTTWNEANHVFQAMLADGSLIRVTEVSPKGRRIKKIRLP